MADAAYLIVIAGAFAGLVGLVRICDRIVRSGAPELAASRDREAGDGR